MTAVASLSDCPTRGGRRDRPVVSGNAPDSDSGVPPRVQSVARRPFVARRLPFVLELALAKPLASSGHSAHTHRWESEPCSLTGTWVFSCDCGAERTLEADHDGTTRETIVEPDESENTELV